MRIVHSGGWPWQSELILARWNLASQILGRSPRRPRHRGSAVTIPQGNTASITLVCGLLAGRLSDDTQGTVREHYAAGEWGLADGTLLLNLAYEDVGITSDERDLIRSFLADPDIPDLLAVPVTDEVRPLYRFTQNAPRARPTPPGPTSSCPPTPHPMVAIACAAPGGSPSQARATARGGYTCCKWPTARTNSSHTRVWLQSFGLRCSKSRAWKWSSRAASRRPTRSQR